MDGIAELSVTGANCKWAIIETKKHDALTAGNEKIKGRYGFQGCYYNSKIYFFFGCQIFDKLKKERTCLNEIVIFDPCSHEISLKFPFHRPERMLNPRKYFAGFFLHDTYYCHGGIDTSAKILDSFISINLKTFQWSDVKYSRGPPLPMTKGSANAAELEDFPAHCYGHEMVVVAYANREYVKIDSVGPIDYGSEKHYIKHEGVYMFGGVIGKTTSESRLTDTLFIMQIEEDAQPRWRAIETTGKPPIGRFHYGLDYYPQGNLLVVFGGRRFAAGNGESEFVTQIAVLRMDSLQWFEVFFKGNNMPPDLYNFSSAIYDDELILFGGMQGNYRQTQKLHRIQMSDRRTTYEQPQSVGSGLAFDDLNKHDDECMASQ